MDPLNLLWFYVVLASLQPVIQRQLLLVRRRAALSSISRARGATVITLIHRQETMSLTRTRCSGRSIHSSTATPPRRSSRWPRCPATTKIRR